jgi:hypothetical protein
MPGNAVTPAARDVTHNGSVVVTVAGDRRPHFRARCVRLGGSVLVHQAPAGLPGPVAEPQHEQRPERRRRRGRQPRAPRSERTCEEHHGEHAAARPNERLRGLARPTKRAAR